MSGDHFLEGDGGGEQTVGLAKEVALGARTGFGEDAVVHAVDGGMGHQRVLVQIAEQDIQAEDVIGHQQLGRRGGGLRDQALANGFRLLLHGVLELHAHHPGADDQREADQQQAVTGDAQGQRNAPVAHCVEQQQEEIVGFYGCGPGHGARLFSNEIGGQYNGRPVPGKAPRLPAGR